MPISEGIDFRNPPVAGVAMRLTQRVTRITAPNAGVMTGPGTNTYVVGERDLAVIDPGPAIASHVAAIVRHAGRRLRWIFVTHTHLDHSPAARAVAAETGAQLIGRPPPDGGRQDRDFVPEHVPNDGEVIVCDGCTLRAVQTPGHASNHLCWLLEEERLLFTGDHIMQGSTVVIAPPDGDMSAYFASLEKVLALDVDVLAPGHGSLIGEPQAAVRRLIGHRLWRERKVVDALADAGTPTLDELLPVVYSDVAPQLHAAARGSLHAHLLKLARDGRAIQVTDRWRAA
jgi:glyoxylase-like metal-dependent hydrolase (beta-lactamase superfamily II)